MPPPSEVDVTQTKDDDDQHLCFQRRHRLLLHLDSEPTCNSMLHYIALM